MNPESLARSDTPSSPATRIGNREKFFAALLLLVVVATAWRVINPHRRSAVSAEQFVSKRPATAFILPDIESHPVNVGRYFGRHIIVLVFYDGKQPLEESATLNRLRQIHPALRSNGVEVFGITNALPQQVEANGGRNYPFHLLSDVLMGQPESVITQWDCIEQTTAPDGSVRSGVRPAIFIIDRAGLVSYRNNRPVALDSEKDLLGQILSQGS
ncbi:MAG: redoxin domain-containing protein [Planctomycetaceae bacterium]|nr:redoxin domain-containing protein [Planctomycetaceae bacterium]